MKYQIILTEAQLNALTAIVGNASSKVDANPDKVNDSVRAIASIDIDNVTKIKTKYRFVHHITSEGYNESDADVVSELSYDDIETCLADMKEAANTQHTYWWQKNSFTILNIEDRADTKYFMYFEMYGKNGAYIKCTTRIEEYEPKDEESNEVNE